VNAVLGNSELPSATRCHPEERRDEGSLGDGKIPYCVRNDSKMLKSHTKFDYFAWNGGRLTTIAGSVK
jgi:hypothetical protein